MALNLPTVTLVRDRAWLLMPSKYTIALQNDKTCLEPLCLLCHPILTATQSKVRVTGHSPMYKRGN